MPQTFVAVLAAVLAVAPGFVLNSVYRRDRSAPDPGEAKLFITSLVASLPVQLLLLPWTLRLARIAVHKNGFSRLDAGELWIWALLLTLVVPVVLGLLFSWLVEWDRIQPTLGKVGWTHAARTTSAWEWMFVPAKSKWLIVTLKDGSLVGGAWGKTSFVSLEPTNPDLFISRPYLIKKDKTFGAARKSTGLWIRGEDIAMIEAFDPKGK